MKFTLVPSQIFTWERFLAKLRFDVVPRGLTIAAMLLLSIQTSFAIDFDHVQIKTGARATPVELKCAELLKARLTENGGPTVQVSFESESVMDNKALVIWLGMFSHHDVMNAR